MTNTHITEKSCKALELTNCVCVKESVYTLVVGQADVTSGSRKVSKVTRLLHTCYTTTWETDHYVSSLAEDFLRTRAK
jgi:hypothetical protein